MTWTLILERILGWFYLIMAISMLLQRQFWIELAQHFKKHVIMGYCAASVAILLGLLIVMTHNTWFLQPTTFVTLFGWIMLIKGVTYFVSPPFFIRFIPPESLLQKILPIEAIALIAISASVLYETYLF